jgi:uncharacterized membrane protein YeaQ/YmgE (transglycosylase-associated protein family)
LVKFIWVGLIVGGIVGQLILSLWGADLLSITSAVFSFIGGALGLWLGFKIDQSLG